MKEDTKSNLRELSDLEYTYKRVQSIPGAE